MIATLVLLAATAAELGTSPLVADSHAHRWVSVQSNAEGDGWIDHAWRSEAVVNGDRLKLVLVRSDIRLESPMLIDVIFAVDCRSGDYGIKEGWLFKSDFGNDMRLPITEVELDFADNPPTAEDQAIIDYACKAG